MKRLTQLILLIFLSLSLLANDGAFFANGNQLIPMGETDISVTKEVLTIKRRNKTQIDVTVYYEFINPKELKKIIVGFESNIPSGDADPAPKNNEHPNIYNFTVDLNNTILPYNVSLVTDSVYYKNGKVEGRALRDINKKLDWDEINDWGSTKYVYYFDAPFKKGLNTIKHTYTFDLSGSVTYNYDFDYVLSAAMRWGNHQIDDFTLIIDMGDFEDFYINNKPFTDSEWIVTGIGKIIKNTTTTSWWDSDEGNKSTFDRFLMTKGQIIFQKKNYKPEGELFLFSERFYPENWQSFDYEKQPTIPIFEIEYEDAADAISRKVLRNLPFARRGYVFSSPELKEYYANQVWYIPNPNYKADMQGLTPKEQQWVNRWK